VSRCPYAISLGWYPEVGTSPADSKGLHSRCLLEDDGHQKHEAKGLAEFDYQRWHWFTSDRRTYRTERTDDHAWERA
jgi:hypothetical protein